MLENMAGEMVRSKSYSKYQDQICRLTSALVVRSHIQDAIGINLKGDLNLRDTAGCRWDACQVKLTQLMVVLGHGTLTLIYLQ